MNRMRNESTFPWEHPLMKMTGSMCLFNIRSWNMHIEHFFTDKVYTRFCNLFCFTETHVKDGPFSNIEMYMEGWADIHKKTNHGLAICYNASKVRIIQEFETRNTLEILPVVIEIENEHVLLVLVYRTPGASRCIHGGILDLVFDNKISELVHWIPSPYSDHFVLIFQI